MKIKIILFLSFIVLAMGKNANGSRKRKSKYLLVELKEPSLRLSWLTNSILLVKIGEKRNNIFLKPTTNIPQINTPCLFSGKVEGDPSSKVFVSGCYNSSETLVTIVSSQLPGGILDLSLVHGITSNVTTQVDQRGRTGKLDYETVNHALFPGLLQAQDYAAYFSGPLPSRVVLRTDIRYDNTLLKHFHHSHQKTKDWINKIVGLTQTRMFHKSIKMKVKIRVLTVGHIAESIKADLASAKDIEKKRVPQFTSYFCKDFANDYRKGIGYVGAACHRDGKAFTIVELWNLDILTAKGFAHELGHIIGMEDDYDPKHGGNGGKCSKKGLMSIPLSDPDMWSDCSNSDFINWWRKEGHACVKEAGGNKACKNKKEGESCRKNCCNNRPSGKCCTQSRCRKISGKMRCKL